MMHHDMDAPPWWHFKRKKMLYIDGFAAKGHRGLMQFMLVRQQRPGEVPRSGKTTSATSMPTSRRSSRRSIRLPSTASWPSKDERRSTASVPIATAPTASGGTYPEKLVPIDEVGTDRVRLDALSPAHRDAYGQSWFTDYGKLDNLERPRRLRRPAARWHLGQRPVLPQRQRADALARAASRPSGPPFGSERRLATTASASAWRSKPSTSCPEDVTSGWQKREYFDTRAFGKKASGHTFPDELSADEKQAVLEYLKTL